MIQLLYLPFLFLHLNQPPVYTYCWERYGLEFHCSLVMNEMSEKDYWDVDDDDLDFWVSVERIPFSEAGPELLGYDLPKATRFLADSSGYEKTKNGSPLPNIPESYYVSSKEDDIKTYIILIMDRKNSVFYEVFIEEFEESKKASKEILESMHFLW